MFLDRDGLWLLLHIFTQIREVPKDGVDAVGEMGGTGANSLGVVLAIANHLGMVDGGELGIPLASDVGIEKERGFDEVGTRLRDMLSFGLGRTALVRSGDHTSPLAKAVDIGKAVDSVNEGPVHGCAGLPDTINGC